MCLRVRRASIVITVATLCAATIVPGTAVADPGVNVQLAAQVSGLSPADLDLLIRVRQAGLWEAPAGSAAQQNAGSDRVRQIGARIADEHHDLDQVVRDVAAQYGVYLPSQPNADQQSWLKELASARGAEFDRVFVERLRTAHGNVFPLIANVRAGTRNELIRAFASTANTYVLRHLSYLESTNLVNFAMLPTPSPSGNQQADSISMTAGGALLPADRDLLVRLRQTDLWMTAAAATAQQQSTNSSVRQAAGLVAAGLSDEDKVVQAVAAQLGIALPDNPTAEQGRWLTQINAAQGAELDRVFVTQLRSAAGSDFIAIANVRAGTRNTLVRAVATSANDTTMQNMADLENTGLVDYNAMPQETAPPGVRMTSLDRGGGTPSYLIWLVLATAAAAAATAVLRLARTR